MLCPKCNSPLESGYGLAGGGIGPYFYCSSDGCDYFEKHQVPELWDQPPKPEGKDVK